MADITAPQPPAYGPPAHAPAVAAQPAAAQAPRPKTALRDVVFGWRAALAVLIAGIVIGGLVGAAITLIADHSSGGSPTTPAGFGSRFGGGLSQFGQSGGSSQFGQGGSSETQPGTGS